MSALSAADVLELWDLAQARPDRLAEALLARARPDLSVDERAALPIGRRDAALIDLRARCLGPRAQARASCPACQEALELELQLADLRAPDPGPPADVVLERGELRLTLRLPTAADVAAAAAAPDPARALLARCAGTDAALELPDDLLAEAAERLAAADAQADLDLHLTCPACGHAWLAPFDIVPFFRAELRAWALRVARDVDTLARAYHWREPDILAMTPARRGLYLELVGA